VIVQHDGSFQAVPSYPGLRLNQDVRGALALDTGLEPVADYTAKQRVIGGVLLARENRPLLAAYALERDDGSVSPTEFAPLGPADALMTLAGSAFRMDVALRDQHRRQLGFFAEVVRRVPIRRCGFADHLSNVGALTDAILKDASASVR